MKISYLVTCSTETETLKRLLYALNVALKEVPTDEVVILMDKKYANDDSETYKFLNTNDKYCNKFKVVLHDLNNDYGSHKNYGIEQCTGDYIFQIDGDELPSYNLVGDNLHELLEANPFVQLYLIPRINGFVGVTEEHAKRWGWRLTLSPTYNIPIVNWPDYQSRIFKRDYPKISFKNKLHERIEGNTNYVGLPADEQYSLYHDKTIEIQEATNLRYNRDFTKEENSGISSEK